MAEETCLEKVEATIAELLRTQSALELKIGSVSMELQKIVGSGKI